MPAFRPQVNDWASDMNLVADSVRRSTLDVQRSTLFASSLQRRAFLYESAVGIGSMALASLLQRDGYASEPSVNPLRARPGHFPAKAKSVIFLFQCGGPSHLELFDPKPTLNRLHGQTVPSSF